MTYTVEVIAPPLVKTQTELSAPLSASDTTWSVNDPGVFQPNDVIQLYFWHERQQSWVPDEVVVLLESGSLLRGTYRTNVVDHEAGVPARAIGVIP